MRGGGTSQPLYKGGGAGRPAAGRPGGLAAPMPGGGPPGAFLQKISRNYCRKAPAAPQRGDQVPAAGRPECIPVNFENKNIFL